MIQTIYSAMRFIFLLCGIGLLAQTPPPPEKSGTWTLVDIKSDPAVHRFEYTIRNSANHAFTGFSTEAIPVRLNQTLKAFVEEPFFIYVIDEMGGVRTLRYVLKKEMVPAKKASGTQN